MVMAFKVFWWQVELLLMGLAGMVLLPTLAFRPLAFVASGVLGYAANAFARFFLGALLRTAVGRAADAHTTRHADGPGPAGHGGPENHEAFYAVGLAWVLACCFLGVNRLAGVLTSGIPAMAGGQSVGAFLHMVTGTGAGDGHGWGRRRDAVLGAARVGAGGAQATLGRAGRWRRYRGRQTWARRPVRSIAVPWLGCRAGRSRQFGRSCSARVP